MTGDKRADLVLEGGGVKGIALVGALSVLEERGYRFNRVAGTSAGAIVGSLVAAGYPATELEEIMRSVEYLRFRDGDFLARLGLLGQAVALIAEHGVYKGDYLEAWLGGLLAARGVTTFSDVRYVDTDRPLPPDCEYRFVAVTSDISQHRLTRLPWDYHHYQATAAEARVVDAVRASMSIPFFYRPVILPGPDAQKCWLVDGGMLSNFPVDIFDVPAGQQPRWPTIGIKLSARPTPAKPTTKPIHGTIDMAKAMLATMTGFYDAMHLEDPAVVDRTIFVDTTGVRATDFDIDPETANWLFDNGKAAATKFLDGEEGKPGFDFDAYRTAHPHPVPAGAAGAPS